MKDAICLLRTDKNRGKKTPKRNIFFFLEGRLCPCDGKMGEVYHLAVHRRTASWEIERCYINSAQISAEFGLSVHAFHKGLPLLSLLTEKKCFLMAYF